MPLQFLIAMWGAWIGLGIIVASEALGKDSYGAGERGHYGTPYGDGAQYGSGGGDQYGTVPAIATPVKRRVAFPTAQV